jgi:hypothetical protein
VTSPADPGVAVWFTWDGMQVCIAVDRYQKVASNLQAIHHIIEARRVELRHGTLALVRASFTAKALEIADESVLCTLSSTCGFPDANGWRECHYHREEHEKKALAYAAARGLIERHPKNKALYKVTTAGQLVRDEEGPTHMSKERAAEILANYKPTVFESRNGKRVEVPFKTPVER